MSAEMEVAGFEELMAKLENMGKIGDDVYDEALTKGAETILKDMQATNAFKDSEHPKLRKSFKISKIKKTSDGKYVWVGDIDGVAKYGWYVEHKTGHAFMRPAFEKHKKEVFEIIKETIAEGIKKNE